LRLKEGGETKPGDSVKVDLFQPKDLVNVIGVSKGRGFAGVIKRHHFAGGGATHGSMFHRAPGSIGQSSYPSRVWKGMRAAGHMGTDRVTVRNLEVVRVVPEDNLLLVKGAVPGANGGYLIIERVSSAS
jgi:large subunit ribosomal protein L3